MIVDYRIEQLGTEAAWKSFASELGGGHLPIVQSIIRHLIANGAQSCVIESRYIDRDYSSDYRRFYAQTFKSYDRHCRRVHFFAENVEPVLSDKKSWSTRVTDLEKTSLRTYLGFCVVRPLPTAPIGRAVLRNDGPKGEGWESVLTTRAKYRANLLGAELEVRGTAFMQQDSRVGACAQVAIWAGARHMHQRYGYGWYSVADITNLAAPTTAYEATSLPAGSDFLTSERMIRAVSEMGFQPLCLEGPNIGDAILPYVESGLPVILGLQLAGSLGHAVTVVGRVFTTLQAGSSNAVDYVQAFIVHDDQAGPYMIVPTRALAPVNTKFDPNQIVTRVLNGAPTALNVEKHGVFAIALMPMRAFSTARAAEALFRERFEKLMLRLAPMKAELAKHGAVPNKRLLNELQRAHKQDEVMLRTYLSSAAGYRRYVAQSNMSDSLKDEILRMHLPHFIWVTEISTIAAYNQASAGMRRLYGHSVIDATSTGRDLAGLLMLHLPGVAIRQDTDAKPGDLRETATAIDNDKLYECREKSVAH